MAKEINYPAPEWVDRWIDNYMDKHPDEKISDFKALEEKAMDVWWRNEIDHDRPTPFDLPEEKKQAQKKLMKIGTRKVTEKVKRERKADDEKADLIAKIAEIFGENAEITNKEREISLKIGENEYSITLIKHRKPKK